MNIWIIKIGEPNPFSEKRKYRAGTFAETLGHAGHKVIWWTTTFDHQEKSYLFDKTTSYKTRLYKLIFLHSNKAYYKNISLSRLLNHQRIAKCFAKKALNENVPDIIVCSFPTINLSYEAIKFGKQHGIPVVIDIRDLWPDIFLTPYPKWCRPLLRIILHPLFRKTKMICRQATALVAVSRGYLNWGLQYASRQQSKYDKVFPLGYSTVLPHATANETKIFLEELSTLGYDKGKTTICFVGTFGQTYDLIPVINCAKKMQRSHPNVQFLMIGDGENMSVWRLAGKTCSNVIFTGWIMGKKLSYLIGQSDIGLMAYSAHAAQGLPNKIYEYMSYGLPIVSSLKGETEAFLKQHNIGLSYEAGNTTDLLKQIDFLLNNQKKIRDNESKCV
jgi:glycosyltransferase involved in cell wall biosynthesis